MRERSTIRKRSALRRGCDQDSTHKPKYTWFNQVEDDALKKLPIPTHDGKDSFEIFCSGLRVPWFVVGAVEPTVDRAYQLTVLQGAVPCRILYGHLKVAISAEKLKLVKQSSNSRREISR